MVKQCASRLIIGVQTGCWFFAILLLLYRGINNLQDYSAAPQQSQIRRPIFVTSYVPGNSSDTNPDSNLPQSQSDSEVDYTRSNGSYFWSGIAYRKPSNPGDHQFIMGLILIAVATLMILSTLAILLARRYERRRYKSVEQIEQPPRYEDVVLYQVEDEEQIHAPRYSSLDLTVSSTNLSSDLNTETFI